MLGFNGSDREDTATCTSPIKSENGPLHDIFVGPCKGGHENWNADCKELCPMNCKQGKCRSYTGECHRGCEDGWFGLHCDHSEYMVCVGHGI